MPQKTDIHFEKDKKLIPYLLACQPLISFVKTQSEGQSIYFGFSPASKALELISQFFTNSGPIIPPRKLLEAVDEFRTILYREKDRARMGYGLNGGG